MSFDIQKTKNKFSQLFKSGSASLIPKTLLNYSLAYFKTGFAAKPIEIQIEMSAVCNLKCLMCNLDKSHDNIKFLTPKHLQKLLSELKPLKSINLTGMGETLLNPYFPKIIALLHRQKVPYTFISNAQLLTPKLIDSIVKYPPQSLSFSIESGQSKTYAKIRRGGTLEKFENNIRQLVAVSEKKHRNFEINFNIVFLDFNLKNLNHIFSILKLAKKIGIKTITTQLPYDYQAESLDKYYKYNSKSIIKIFKEIKDYSDNLGLKLSLPNPLIKEGSCYYPWIYPQITASGELLPCCVIPQADLYSKVIKKYSFGNVFNNSFSSVWNGPKAKNFRYLLKNSPCLDCKKCSKYRAIL